MMYVVAIELTLATVRAGGWRRELTFAPPKDRVP